MKYDLTTKISGLCFNTPLIAASGTFGYGPELEGLVDFSSLGAVVTKTITLNPRAGNPPPRIYELEHGIMNSVGLENPGLDAFMRDKLPEMKEIKTKRIVSVGGFKIREYVKIVEALTPRKEIDAFEINLSCPNLRLKKLTSQNEKETFRLVKKVRQATAKPLIVKITPEVTDIAAIAQAVASAGADAVAMVNTFFSLAIDIDSREPCLGKNIFGGYSGPAIKPMSVYRVWRAASCIDIPIIAGGGIFSFRDALEFILAGASAVSLGTVNFTDPGAAADILDGIAGYMKAKKITAFRRLVGKLKIPK